MTRITGTQRQEQCLSVIRSHIDQHGVVPSYREIREVMGLNSNAGVHRMVSGLEARGIITRQPGRARCIQIVSPARDALLTVLDEFKWSPECRAELLAKMEGAE